MIVGNNHKHHTHCELCGDALRKEKRVGRGSYRLRYCMICCPTSTARQRADRYKLSQPAFNELLRKQNGLCALCTAKLHTDHINGLHIDHDHMTNKVRGLLCGHCNHGLGFLERMLTRQTLNTIYTYMGLNETCTDH